MDKNKSGKVKPTRKQTATQMDVWQKLDQFFRNKWVIGFMLVIVSFVYNHNYASLYDRKIDLNGDNIYYYSLGQALSHGEGYYNIIGYEKTPHSHFPPGYPWFISKIIKVFPENVQTVKKANGFLMWLNVMMMFFVVFLTTRNSILSFCSSLLMSVHKELLRFATIMMSESLFIFLSLLAIILALLILKDKIGEKRRWMLPVVIVIYGLVIAYTYLVRTMGLSLILALIGWLGIVALYELVRWRKAAKQSEETVAITHKLTFIKVAALCLMTVLAVGTAKLSWDARNRKLNLSAGDYEALFMQKTNNETMDGIEDWKTRIKSNTAHFVARWIPEATYMKPHLNNDEKITGKEWAAGLLLLAVIFYGCLYLNMGRLLMMFYLAITVGVLILFPEQYGGTRYIVPIMPFLIFLLLNGLSAIVAGIYKIFKLSHPPFWAQGLLLLIVTFGVLMPKYLEAQTDHKQTAKIKSWLSSADVNAVNFLNAAKFCGDSLPKDARILDRKPELFYMFSNYHPSSSFPHYADPDTIYQLLCRDSIDYIIIDNWFRHAYVTLYPCVQKYPEKFKEIKKFGDVDTVNKINPTFIFQFNDHWGYHGEMKDGVREGQGELNLPDGRSYKGTFANGMPNGYGTLYDSNGVEVVSGLWRNGALYQVNR